MSGRVDRHLTQFRNVSVSGSVITTTDLSGAGLRHLIVGRAGYTIFIQRIGLSITVDNAATQVFQDTASTPVKVAAPKASPGLGPIIFDFGTEGFALTADKGFDLANSGAGLAYMYAVQAYERPTADTQIAAAAI